MSKKKKAAVADYVSREYDRLVFQEQNSYVSLNAQSDPDGWQERLREQIAADAERVREIMGTGSPKLGGFTLIELSIVLIIIGLIVGGVLVGQDLIRAAAVRAQVSQIEKFNTAANTFREKYGYLPGDIKDPDATSFGFLPRGSASGQGDGNGVIQANVNSISTTLFNTSEVNGETVMFWTDLSTAHLIEGTFNIASPTTVVYVTSTSVPGINSMFPAAKIGHSNDVYVYSGGTGTSSDGINYFGISVITKTNNWIESNVGLTVLEAQAIDKKMDDGLPQLGNVKATYLNFTAGTSDHAVWATGGGGSAQGVSNTASTPSSATTCYDNGGNAGVQQYSVEISNGSNVNCALSFRMQAGD